MEEVAALLHDPAGEAVLTEAWAGLSGRPAAFAEEELLARQQLLAWQFAGQLEACVDAFVALAGESNGITRAMLRRATERLLWVFPVYRTYATGKGAPANDRDIRATVRARVAAHVAPGEQRVVDLILGWLAGEGGPDAADAVRRFQQLSAPIAAKSVEDTAFYRYARLLSRNDVGFDAARWSLPIAAFHARMAARAADWPDAMLTTATHDHKRGEDVRARLAVLSEMPGSWLAAVAAWDRLADEVIGGIDPADRYALWQTLVGSWPLDGPAGDYGERVRQWQQKALREAKLRSSWEAPDEAYEERCGRLVDGAAGGELGRAIAGFVATIAPAARANMLAQTVLRYTVPGVPDLYQGTECIDLSLVDPDNRRPVDYVARARKLAEASDEKLSTIARLLAIRRQEPRLFRRGRYVAASVEGPLASKILAFSRIDGGRRLDVAVLIHGAGLAIGGSDGSDDGRYAETMLSFDRAPPRDAGMLKDTPAWFELAACGD
jgi:(1->4)-alpha-D-glucan 1-alpha-D-glucosylmutase